MRGIGFNGKHSWNTFQAVISSSSKPLPEKKIVEETVPYSNVTYDFSCLNGKQTYKDRTLQYVFTFRAPSRKGLLRKIDDFTDWLYSPGERIPLYDDEEDGIHYLAKCTAVDAPSITGCTASLAVTFTAYPLRIPDRPSVRYTVRTAPYPDVNGDGTADAVDASLILKAAASLAIGQDTGLTAEQLNIADADRDGTVSALDASLLLEFVSAAGMGKYTDNGAGWVRFMNDHIAREEGKP